MIRPVVLAAVIAVTACAGSNQAVRDGDGKRNDTLMLLARTLRETWALATAGMAPYEAEDLKPYFKLAARTLLDTEDALRAGAPADWAVIWVAWKELQRQISAHPWTPPIAFEQGAVILQRLTKESAHAAN